MAAQPPHEPCTASQTGPPSRARSSTFAHQRPLLGALRLVGFGANDTSGTSGYGIKRSTDVPVLGWGCDGYRARSTGCDPAWDLLIPRSGDRDTCDGDSGGPVLEWRGEQCALAWGGVLPLSGRITLQVRRSATAIAAFVEPDDIVLPVDGIPLRLHDAFATAVDVGPMDGP